MSDDIRISDPQLAAPLAHGCRTFERQTHFTFDFTVPDESDASSSRVVIQRVHLDASAVEELVNQLNLQLNGWKMRNEPQ